MTKDEEANKPTERSAGKTDNQSRKTMHSASKQQNSKTDSTAQATTRKVVVAAESKTKEKVLINAGANDAPVSGNPANASFGSLPNGSSTTATDTKSAIELVDAQAESLEDRMDSSERSPSSRADAGGSQTPSSAQFDKATNEPDDGSARLGSPEGAHQQAESHPMTGAPVAPNPCEADRHGYSYNPQQNPHQPNSHQHKQQRATRKQHHQQQQQQLQMTSTSSASFSDQQVPVSADYLAQLIKDKKQLAAFPSVFIHVQRLIDEEINKVRQSLFQLNDVVNQNEPLELPEPEGEFVQLQEKIYVPVDEHPEYNFVGRLLGPRGMTAKQLEQETGCKIMIRGRGSMRDKKKVSFVCPTGRFVSLPLLHTFARLSPSLLGLSNCGLERSIIIPFI